ncbi:MAG: HutD family protein [Proteobacteria bacterium]|nr:HutD family protein [Pseudomonadota bacterium]
MKVLRQADYASQAWKNGSGVSRRIASFPENASFDEGMLWQLSLPVIAADSPFSPFPGFDRQFMVLSGKGVSLSFRHAAGDVAFSRKIDVPLRPFAFRGDWAADCKLLDGPVEDLSLLSRRGKIVAKLELRALHAISLVEKAAADTLLLYAARGSLRVFGRGGAAVLAEQDTLLEPPGNDASFALSGASGGAVVAILTLSEI